MKLVPNEISRDEFANIRRTVESALSPFGFECSPLLTKWYNDNVGSRFALETHPDTLMFCVCSNVSMFERGFLPFLFSLNCTDRRNALDECVQFHLRKACHLLQDYKPLFFKDSDVDPRSRRPSFLAQPAAHVAGVAYYYHPREIISEADQIGVALPWSQDYAHKVFGVSIHPKYGGWFAIRGLIVLQSAQFSSLEQKMPLDVIESTAEKVRLLLDFNFDNWKNWSYRDVVPVEPEFKYSQLQRKYFQTEPKLRMELLGKELGDAYRAQNALSEL